MSRILRSTAVLSAFALLAACGGGTPPPPPAGEATRAAAPPPTAEPAGGAEGEYHFMAVADGGGVAGKVTVAGSVPAPEKVEVNKDQNVCGTEKVLEDVQVGAGGALANAVVWIDGIGSGKAWADGRQGTVDQKECHYVPHIQALAPGANLDILNSDPILHNIHAYSGEETLFNIAQPIKGQKTTKKLARSGPVQLKCDVHSWMSAYVFVAASPYYAITGADGSYSIGDVPPGTYTVKVWHGKLGEKSTSVTVAPKGTAAADFEIQAS
jgi:plastocyanin